MCHCKWWPRQPRLPSASPLGIFTPLLPQEKREGECRKGTALKHAQWSPRPLGGSSKTCTFTSLSAHILSNRTQCSFSNFANGERIAFARESAKRVGPMLEQHHLPRREKRQMPSCRWRRSKYFVFRYSTLYTVRKPHQRHVLIAHCTSREHTTWHSLPSERSTNDAQEERFLCKRFSPPLRLYLPRRETGAFLGDLAKVVAPGLRPHSWSRDTIRDAARPYAAKVPLRRNGRNCGVPSDRTAGRMAQVRSLQRCWYALAPNHWLHTSCGARPLHKCTYDQRTHVARRVCGSCCQDMS